VLPRWFRHVGEKTYAGDVRVRRYFPAFLEACATVCLLRSFQRNCGKRLPEKGIEIDFADFAIAAIIFNSVFTESLHRGADQLLETRNAVKRIATAQGGKPVNAELLAADLRVSRDRAYALLRQAAEKGVVQKINPPERTNRKLFLPAPVPRFIPDPEQLFEGIDGIPSKIKFVHPFTGTWVTYRKG
jgi:hypothetical protein